MFDPKSSLALRLRHPRVARGLPVFVVQRRPARAHFVSGLAGENVLTHDVTQSLPAHPAGGGPRVVYGEACRLGPKSLERYGIAFRQIPFELRVD